jgi:hypothetical protein
MDSSIAMAILNFPGQTVQAACCIWIKTKQEIQVVGVDREANSDD